MALPLFVVSTADSEGVRGVFSGSHNWYILLLVTTRLTKYSNTAFATRKPETGSLVTRAQIFVISFGNKQSRLIYFQYVNFNSSVAFALSDLTKIDDIIYFK
jgi:hypothetical protein